MNKINMNMAKHESMINVWRERVRECKTSGMTVAGWCEKNNITKKTYYYWQKQVWDHAINTMNPGQPGLPSPVQFAEISVPTNVTSGGNPDIVLHQGGWTVEIRNSVDPMLLHRILEAVGCHV